MKHFIIIILLGTLAALGYIIFKNQFYLAPGQEQAKQTSTTTASDAPTKQAGEPIQAKGIRAEETIPSKITVAEEPSSVDITEDTFSSETVGLHGDTADRIRGIENIGSADAKTSTEYDHAGGELILYAELNNNGIALEWSKTQNESFTSYVIVRSSADENPFYPKTAALATLADRKAVSFLDASAEAGKDYAYRVCYTRSNNERAACGNILKIMY